MRNYKVSIILPAILTVVFVMNVAIAGEVACNDKIQKLLTDKKITFDPTAADAEKLGVDEKMAAIMKKRVELGGAFFTCKDKDAFVEAMSRITPKADAKEHLLIGWFVVGENRYVGPKCSKTPEQIKTMTDEQFDKWRKGWDIDVDRNLARFSPTPSKAGNVTDTKSSSFAITRALLETTDKDEFLKRALKLARPSKDGSEAKSLVIGVYQRCEMVVDSTVSVHSNALNVADLKDLTAAEFKTWRRRFLRFIDLQSPGQSNVKLFVRLSGAQFAAHLAMIRGGGTLPSGTINFGIILFERWSGITLVKPNYATSETEPVIASVRAGSPGDKAGLKAGDVILEVEGSEILEWDEFSFYLSSFQEGSKISLLVETDPSKRPEKKYYRVGKRLASAVIGTVRPKKKNNKK